jgi:hypothetical protein
VSLGFVGGQVFKGLYGVHVIAAKQVYSTGKSAQDFEREAATLAKLSHPFIMQLFGISHGMLGATRVVVSGWDQKRDKGCGWDGINSCSQVKSGMTHASVERRPVHDYRVLRRR